MRFSNSFVDDLLARVSISQVIGNYVTWDKKKTNVVRGDYWACCPFHQEKTPSFHCNNNKGYYYCFSCHASGNHISFLSAIKGFSFADAIQQIADIAGVSVPRSDLQTQKSNKTEEETLISIIEMATLFFQNSLQNQSAEYARGYLNQRGINSRSIEIFRLGYAPDNRHALTEYLTERGVPREKIEASGLIVHGSDIPVSYDRFRHRIIFPIFSAAGKVIAFGGRALSKDIAAKYLNSNETILFRKGELLYNFFGARNALKRILPEEISKRKGVQPQSRETVVLVEGYMDVISLHQSGIQNVVSPLGTAITERQLQLLWQLSLHPVVCFDGDEAGFRAASRLIDLALPYLQPEKSLSFIILPNGKDPDSFIREEGKEAFELLIAQALPFVAMLWQRETVGDEAKTPEMKAALETRLQQAIERINHKTLRYHYLQDIRQRLYFLFQKNSSYQHSQKKSQRYHPSADRFSSVKLLASERLQKSKLVQGSKSQQPSLRETVLLLTLINHPQLLVEDYDELLQVTYQNPDLQNLWSCLISEFVVAQSFSHEKLLEKLQERGFTALLQSLDQQIRKVGLWSITSDADLVDARQGYQQALKLYKRSRFLYQQKVELENQIAEATEREEEEQIVSLLNRLNHIQLEIKNIENQDAMVSDSENFL
ncbi:DNA primase [Liberibacter crescens BT-1]|uniref:DNA primase n=1 Tax=Liberibacter crescens (strain BT-1) TaxID=1215343 RepID=L0EUD9_LIBCB|nr:DNA primase [Liberibacter crescens]AGA64567.1 DNA primase [Liberibacter crescens BT-1]AMC12708.1 DNA primase [Liberibacter crescens]